jgi:hypothetical protein
MSRLIRSTSIPVLHRGMYIDGTCRVEATPSTRRRGRPKKPESSLDTADDTITVSVPNSTRRRGRSKRAHADEDADDASYQPTESDRMEEGDEDVKEVWEAGALAWGLITIGGLGKGSAGIYGAEIMAR